MKKAKAKVTAETVTINFDTNLRAQRTAISYSATLNNTTINKSFQVAGVLTAQQVVQQVVEDLKD